MKSDCCEKNTSCHCVRIGFRHSNYSLSGRTAAVYYFRRYLAIVETQLRSDEPSSELVQEFELSIDRLAWLNELSKVEFEFGAETSEIEYRSKVVAVSDTLGRGVFFHSEGPITPTVKVKSFKIWVDAQERERLIKLIGESKPKAALVLQNQD